LTSSPKPKQIQRNIAVEQHTFDEVLTVLEQKRLWARKIFARLQRFPIVRPGAQVLDLGCASGAFIAAATELGFQCKGIEPWEEAIQNSKKLGQHLGMNLDIHKSKAETLPFADNQFDIIHAASLIEHVEDCNKVFREAFRVLKPGGVFWFLTASSLCPHQHEIRGFPLFGWYPQALKMKAIRWTQKNKPHLLGHTATPAIHWFTPWKARRLLKKAGFSQVYDRWDLREDMSSHSLHNTLLSVIQSTPITKFVADVIVSECSYAAIK
jgi:ubiquinone/menaquinone biosynthesis C-methylase UbiE